MNNDETERLLDDFILNEDKKLQKLIDTLERLEKAGTLDKLFEGAKELSPIEQMKCMFSHCDDSFEEARRVYALATAQELTDMYEHLRKAKFYSEWVSRAYQNYKSRENEIKNPLILKFIGDYENYYGPKNKEESGERNG